MRINKPNQVELDVTQVEYDSMCNINSDIIYTIKDPED